MKNHNNALMRIIASPARTTPAMPPTERVEEDFGLVMADEEVAGGIAGATFADVVLALNVFADDVDDVVVEDDRPVTTGAVEKNVWVPATNVEPTGILEGTDAMPRALYSIVWAWLCADRVAAGLSKLPTQTLI